MRSFIPLLTLTGFSVAATLRPIRQRQPVFDDLVDTLRGPNSDSEGWIPDPWNDRVSSTTDGAATATDVPTVMPGTDTPITVPDVTVPDVADGDDTDGGNDDGGDGDNDGGDGGDGGNNGGNDGGDNGGNDGGNDSGDGGNNGGNDGDDGGDDGTGNGPNTPVTLPNIPGDNNGGPVTLPNLPGAGNPGAGDGTPIAVPDLTGGNPGAGGDDGTDGDNTDGTDGDNTDGTDGDNTDGTDGTPGDSLTTLPATPITAPDSVPVLVRPINGSVPIRFPATPAAGQAESCLSSEAAEVIVDAYVRMISKWNDEDAYYLSESFYDTSDSINSLAGIPLGTVTFPSKEAFIEHQHVMPDNLPLVITHKIVDCTEITLIWTATFAVPHVQAKPVRGIAILKTVGELEDTESEYVKGENDYIWKIGGLDVEFNNIAYLQNIGGSCEFPTGP
ncbi:hypothetical protein QBC41DRAFT_55316 [Cercophora samala]|uniref:NTF2-like domain-containing protein n=1 Tax=Cercophora samala TaxID=330535 RepID=A0AA40D0N7_9PEZI|nr:hypothetical protein QBC41DRAFT_55316 [Cercophora samala]